MAKGVKDVNPMCNGNEGRAEAMIRAVLMCAATGAGLAVFAALGSDKTEQFQVLAMVAFTCAFAMGLTNMVCVAIKQMRKD